MSETIQSENLQTSPKARGERVESLRGLTRLSRRAFEVRYGVPKSSLQNWEDAKGNGLTEKGARKLIRAIKSDGIHCSYEWLMYGMGLGPQIFRHFSNQATPDSSTEQQLSLTDDKQVTLITSELLLFRQHYPKTAIDFVVLDDGMEPRFIIGEYVAGPKHHKKAIERLVGMDCIVQTNQGDVLLRNIKKAEAGGCYTLACSNPNTKVEKPIMYEVELLAAAPVIWARRRDPSV